jgi:hypothetical protein
MSTEVFGLPKGDPDTIADKLGAVLGLDIKRHSSSYLGNYCICRGDDGTRIKVLRNREPRGRGKRPAVNAALHRRWESYKVLMYVEVPGTDPERLHVALLASLPTAVALREAGEETTGTHEA